MFSKLGGGGEEFNPSVYNDSILIYEKTKEDPSNTLLLMHFNNSVADSSPYNRQAISQNNVSYGTGVFENGCYINTLASWIEFDRTWFIDLFNTGIYTIEFWSRYIYGDGNWASFLGIDDGTVNGFVCNCQYGYVFQYGIYNDQMLTRNLRSYGVDNGSWFHYAIVSDGSMVHLYLNGVERDSGPIKTVNFPNQNLTIGGRRVGNDVRNQNYIDELRISNIVRYTGNFTPPTNPFSI